MVIVMVHSLLFMVYSYSLVLSLGFRFWFVVMVVVSGCKVLQFKLTIKLTVKGLVFMF